MTKTYLLSDILKIIGQDTVGAMTFGVMTFGVMTFGAMTFGAMTFGAYNQYITNKIIELYCENQELKQKHFMDKIENQYKIEINELREQIKKCQTNK